LPFFLDLMEHLAANGLACPLPVHGSDGVALRELCGRPAAIVTFLEGMWPRRVLPRHCAAVGEALARLHLAGASFPASRPNNLAVAGWRDLFERCRGRADQIQPGLSDFLASELDELQARWPVALPTGIIHADLFPDNVFFRGEVLSGLIDFYFACTDFLAYDLAICLNAWCFEPDDQFNATKARQLFAGYCRVRPLDTEELTLMPLLARGAAMRFLLTRLYDWLNRPEGALVTPKNPREYLRKLHFHRGVRGLGGYGLDVVAAPAAGSLGP
jgi:homoserine kinase type II